MLIPLYKYQHTPGYNLHGIDELRGKLLHKTWAVWCNYATVSLKLCEAHGPCQSYNAADELVCGSRYTRYVKYRIFLPYFRAFKAMAL